MAINSQSQGQSHTLLVVDDDNDIRDLLQTELELEGFCVFTAHNGAVGVEIAKTQKPDVILMDVIMPKMSGIEAAKILKSDENTKYIPIIMVTSEGKKEHIVTGLEAGAIDYVMKPFFLPELKARVRAVLRFRNIHDDLIKMKEELIKKEMTAKIRDTTNIIHETVYNNVEIILTKLKYVRTHRQYLSEEDFSIIESAATNIKNTVANLSFLDTLTYKVYHTISGIAERIH